MVRLKHRLTEATRPPERGVKAATFRLLLDTAMELIRQQGRVPSIAEVAVRSKVSRATTYRYFPSREALLEALGTVAVEEAGQGLATARVDEVAVEEAFIRAVRALVMVGDYFVVLARERARVAPDGQC